MLRRSVEFPESRKTLRLIRRFGSRKRLLVALAWRPRHTCDARQQQWPYLVRLQLRRPKYFDSLIFDLCDYRGAFNYKTIQLLILVGLDTTKSYQRRIVFQRLSYIRWLNIRLLRLMITHKPWKSGLSNILCVYFQGEDRGKGREFRYHAVKLYLDAGVNVNVRDSSMWTPLHYAAEEDEPETMKLLLDAGAYVNIRDEDNHTPLWVAEQCYPNGESIKLLKAAGAV